MSLYGIRNLIGLSRPTLAAHRLVHKAFKSTARFPYIQKNFRGDHISIEGSDEFINISLPYKKPSSHIVFRIRRHGSFTPRGQVRFASSVGDISRSDSLKSLHHNLSTVWEHIKKGKEAHNNFIASVGTYVAEKDSGESIKTADKNSKTTLEHTEGSKTQSIQNSKTSSSEFPGLAKSSEISPTSPPKKRKTLYHHYLQDSTLRAKLKTQNPAMSDNELFKLSIFKWNQMSLAEREQYKESRGLTEDDLPIKGSRRTLYHHYFLPQMMKLLKRIYPDKAGKEVRRMADKMWRNMTYKQKFQFRNSRNLNDLNINVSWIA
ncbi:hypothetical protein WICPIJ_005114 [Wickerhamomyces pijperi]|uniref:HMG box domain-containing protein n=1 Tax=Wickerhamomyces pijperi TaxID=599730 RepID=A0A9P8TM90_WICPI|nr:hypothetical protein WICPIJ_005114 [Wickerhamomyces pijperi]